MSVDPQIERYMAQAHALRAQYLAQFVRQAWGGIRRLVHKIILRSRAIRTSAPLNPKATARSMPPGAA